MTGLHLAEEHNEIHLLASLKPVIFAGFFLCLFTEKFHWFDEKIFNGRLKHHILVLAFSQFNLNKIRQKMKKIALLVSLSLIFLSSCIIGPSKRGNGHVVEQNRKVSSFDAIKVGRGMNVYISQGNETKVVVKADENLLDVIHTEVDKNTLKITTTANIRRATSKKVFVMIPEISAVTASAGSNVYSETTLRLPTTRSYKLCRQQHKTGSRHRQHKCFGISRFKYKIQG